MCTYIGIYIMANLFGRVVFHYFDSSFYRLKSCLEGRQIHIHDTHLTFFLSLSLSLFSDLETIILQL